MKSAQDILPYHEQKHDNSCVAWGLEAILKMHEEIGLNDYPLQNGADPCGYGFGQKEQQILKQYKIDAKDNSFDLPDFEQMASLEAQKGFPLIFSIPDRLVIQGQTALQQMHVQRQLERARLNDVIYRLHCGNRRSRSIFVMHTGREFIKALQRSLSALMFSNKSPGCVKTFG